jgi:predicted neuraminidase
MKWTWNDRLLAWTTQVSMNGSFVLTKEDLVNGVVVSFLRHMQNLTPRTATVFMPLTCVSGLQPTQPPLKETSLHICKAAARSKHIGRTCSCCTLL